MKFIGEYEVYLSSNGVIFIEDNLGCSIHNLNMDKIGFKTIIVLMCGVLWEKNKLNLESCANVFDQLLQTKKITINELVQICKSEIANWSKVLKDSYASDEDKKK